METCRRGDGERWPKKKKKIPTTTVCLEKMGECLPDDVIEYIFTLRSPKDLIQTTLLAKRWRDFWFDVPLTRLTFDDVRSGPSLNFLERFLDHRSSSITVIQRLIMHVVYEDAETVYKSVSTALSLGVRELHLSPPHPYYYSKYCVTKYMVPIPLLFSAPHLTTLKLRRFKRREEDEFYITCPDLENLVLHDCNFGGGIITIWRLTLQTPKLKNLEMDYHDHFTRDLEMKHTPNLSSFSYVFRGDALFCSLRCSFGNQAVVVPHDDPFSNGQRSSPSPSPSPSPPIPIEKASHAWVSAVGQYQTLEHMTITLGNLFKSYDNIRSLELCANFERPVHVARFASVLMSNCSCIEILVLKVVDHPKSEYQNYIEAPELPLSCTLSKLKYIGVQVEGLDCELELFRFLLCSAVNLLRMTVAWKHSEHKIGDLKLFHHKISQEYPKVHFLFQFS